MLADIDLRRACECMADHGRRSFQHAAVLEAGGYRMSVGTMPRGRRLSRGMILKPFACRVRYG
jgi:hypothetical protein